MEKRRRELRYSELVAYGVGGIFINLGIICDQFSMYFLTNIALIPAATVGTIMLLTTIFDAVNDPIIGNMADQCNSRIGKYRPYIIAGGIGMCITMVLRFTVPPFGMAGKVVYYAIVFAAFSVAFTACCVPWQASMSILSKDYHDRNLLLTVRSLSGAVMNAVIGAILMQSVEKLGGGATGWQRFVICAWIVGLPCVYVCQRGMKRVDYQGSLATPEKRPFLKQWSRVLKNKPVVCVCCAIGLASLAQSLAGNGAMYYYEYVLQDTGVLAVTSVYSFPIAVGSALLLPFVLKRIDKRYLMVIAFAISMVRPVALILIGSNLSVGAATWLVVISRVGTVLFNNAIYAWVPECVDFTRLRDGVGSIGLISASVTFMQKIGRACGQWLAGLFLGFVGFDATQLVTQRITQEILNINGLYQAIGLTIALIPILFFPISKAKGDEIRLQLETRDNSK